MQSGKITKGLKLETQKKNESKIDFRIKTFIKLNLEKKCVSVMGIYLKQMPRDEVHKLDNANNSWP